MARITVRGLPVDQFAAFWLFCHGDDAEKDQPAWPCGAERPWTARDAARAAASCKYALGEPSVVSADPREAELQALARWLAILGTEEGYAASVRVLNLPRQPVENSFSFAFDDQVGGQAGWDRGAWQPIADLVCFLNAWSVQALEEFHGARSDHPSEAEPAGGATAPAADETTPQTEPRPPSKEDLQGLYDARVTPEHAPTWAEDLVWRPGMGITRARLRELRNANPDKRLHERHRRPR